MRRPREAISANRSEDRLAVYETEGEICLRYILKDNISLRSWKGAPYRAYCRHVSDAITFSKDEFEVLKLCDGEQDIETDGVDDRNDALHKLLERELITPAEYGRKLGEWQRLRVYDHPYMPSIYLRITGRCNFNCRHCFNAADENRDVSEWTMPELIRLFDEAKEYGIHCFRLTGGEPLLHPDLLRAIEEIQKRDMFVQVINTNAHFINGTFLDKLKDTGARPGFFISFDCIGHHDWMRRQEDAEKRAIENIKLCIEKGFPVLLNVQLNKVTRDTLNKTAEYFEGLGVGYFRVIRTTESPRWARLAGDASLSLTEYFDECVRFMAEYAKKPGKMRIVCWEFASLDPTVKMFGVNALRCGTDEYHPGRACCSERRKCAAVGADGTLYPDHEASGYYDMIGTKFGNVKSDGLAKALENSEYLKISRMTIGELAEKGQKCKACPHFLQCLGGCRAMAHLGFKADEYGPDPAMCAFFEGDYCSKLVKALPDYKIHIPLEEHGELTEKHANMSGDAIPASACDVC